MAGRLPLAVLVIALAGVVGAACAPVTSTVAGTPVSTPSTPPLVLHREGFTNRLEVAQPGNYYLLSIAKPDQHGPIVNPRPNGSAVFALSVARDSALSTTPATVNPSAPPMSPSETVEEKVTVRGKPGVLWGVGDPRTGANDSRPVLRGCLQWRESTEAIAQLCLGEGNVYVQDGSGDPDSRKVLTDAANDLVVPSGEEWFTLQKGTDRLNSPKPTPFYASSRPGAHLSVGQYGEGSSGHRRVRGDAGRRSGRLPGALHRATSVPLH